MRWTTSTVISNERPQTSIHRGLLCTLDSRYTPSILSLRPSMFIISNKPNPNPLSFPVACPKCKRYVIHSSWRAHRCYIASVYLLFHCAVIYSICVPPFSSLLGFHTLCVPIGTSFYSCCHGVDTAGCFRYGFPPPPSKSFFILMQFIQRAFLHWKGAERASAS